MFVGGRDHKRVQKAGSGPHFAMGEPKSGQQHLQDGCGVYNMGHGAWGVGFQKFRVSGSGVLDSVFRFAGFGFREDPR